MVGSNVAQERRTMKKKVRMRRLDQHNFVIEKWTEPKKGDREWDGWSVSGYYSSIPSMLTDAVNTLAWGDSGAELSKAVETCTKTILKAFHEACETGAFVLDEEAKAEDYRKRAAKRKATLEASRG